MDTVHEVDRRPALPASVQLVAGAEPVAVEPGSTALTEPARLSMLDSLPVAVLLIDNLANVRFVNHRTEEMIGLQRSEMFGRNILDFVLVDDMDFAAELLDAGGEYGPVVMGPSRIRYVDALGDVHWTQVWASAAPPELGIEGFILSLTKESVRDVLATAVASVAADDELDGTLAAVAQSARAMPLCGRGAILVVESESGSESSPEPETEPANG